MLIKTNLRERIADRLTGGAFSSLRKDVAEQTSAMHASELMVEHVKESLLELEAERRVSGGSWVNTGTGDGGKQHDFSRSEIRNIARDGRLKYLKSPLIRRCVDVSALYTFAQGVTVHCAEEKANAAIQQFWDERTNRKAFTSVNALFIKEVERKTQGNIFLAIYADPMRGATPRVRKIPADQITEVVSDPEDEEEIWFYRRVWSTKKTNELTGVVTTEARDEYYPALSYPGEPPQSFGGKPVAPARVYHVKSGGLSDMEFGVADTYPSHNWDTSYSEFLEDRAAVAASLSIFAWMGKAQAGLSRMMSSLSATARGVRRAVTGGSNVPAGQIGGLRDGDSLDPVNVSGATIHPEEGRAYRTMAIGALGLSEPLGTGDVSTGNLATAESLDWPTALQFMMVQALWEEVFTDIISYVLTVMGFDASKAGIMVDWPPVIHQNTLDTVNAISASAPHFPGMEGRRFIAQRLIAALGEDKADEILNKMDFSDPKPIIDPALLNGKSKPPVGPPVGVNN